MSAQSLSSYPSARITIKVLETSNVGLPSCYDYPRKAMRVVVCGENQRGWKSERGVRVVKESGHYNPNAPLSTRSKRGQIARRYNRFAHLLSVLTGIPAQTL